MVIKFYQLFHYIEKEKTLEEKSLQVLIVI